MKKIQSTSTNKGALNTKAFSLIEIILASSIFLLLTTFFLSAFLYGQESMILNGKRNKALMLAEEGLEAARNIRDSGSLLNNGVYGLDDSSGQWELTNTPDIIDEFTRQIEISTIDNKRKNIISSITWQQNSQRSGTLSLEMHLNDWAKKVFGNWANPIIESSLSVDQNDDGIGVTVNNDYAYVIIPNSSPNFFILNISDATNPIITSTINLDKKLSDLHISGNYVYVTSDNNKHELQIVDVTDKFSPVLVSSYDIPGNSGATQVWSDGSWAYVLESYSKKNNQEELYIINVSNPNLPTLAGSLDLEDSATGIIVSGNYAYLSSADPLREFQVIDISNKSLPVRISSLDISTQGGDFNGQSITINSSSNTAFVSCLDNTIYPIDISDKLNPGLIIQNGWASNGSTYKMVLFNNDSYLALANNDIEAELKILDVSNLPLITQLSSVDVLGINDNFNPQDIDYSQDYDKLLMVGTGLNGAGSEQLVIISPQ